MGHQPDLPNVDRASTTGIPPVGDLSIGPATRQVTSARIKTVQFNGLGQFSLLIGIALSFVLAAACWARGFEPQYFVPFTFGGLYLFSGLGFHLGLRGYRAAARGLATNRTISVLGMALTALFIVAETVWLLVRYF